MAKILPASRRGNALIELALVLPVMVLMLAGLADFARVLYVNISLAGAARAGAGYASQSPAASDDTEGVVRAVTGDAVDIQPVKAAITRACYCPERDGRLAPVACNVTACPTGNPTLIYVTVTAQKNFNTLLAWPQVPRQSEIRQSATLRVQ